MTNPQNDKAVPSIAADAKTPAAAAADAKTPANTEACATDKKDADGNKMEACSSEKPSDKKAAA